MYNVYIRKEGEIIMGGYVDNMVGKRYGRLVGIEQRGFDRYGRARWLWRCDCGVERTIPAYVVKNGHSRSCGCLLKDCESRIRHGGYGSRLYKTWNGMKSRCKYKCHPSYKNYGARGISVCKEWEGFVGFREWALSSGYDDTLTIERIDNDGNYCPKNCTWIPRQAQGRHKRNVVQFEINGITKPLIVWAEEFGVPQKNAYSRYIRGKYPFRENEMNKSILEKRKLKKL